MCGLGELPPSRHFKSQATELPQAKTDQNPLGAGMPALGGGVPGLSTIRWLVFSPFPTD